MDKEIIHLFREKVNDPYWLCDMYSDIDGKDKWGAICSAMDWIDVSLHGINSINIEELSRIRDDNEISVRAITLISCISILWESIQQLHRVFIDEDSEPFKNECSVFSGNCFKKDDNTYFKLIRACFAAHPVNLKDIFPNDNTRYYAGWSSKLLGSFYGNGNLSVSLYSNSSDNSKSNENIVLGIYYNELITFAKQRYEYLTVIMGKIDIIIEKYERDVEKHKKKWRKKIIPQSDDPLEQINILLSEEFERKIYHGNALRKLKILFETPVSNPKNLAIVEIYRDMLLEKIKIIYNDMQSMNYSDFSLLSSHDHYIYDKFRCSFLYRDGDVFDTIVVDDIKEDLNGIVDFTGCTEKAEIFLLAETGFFFKAISESKLRKVRTQ